MKTFYITGEERGEHSLPKLNYAYDALEPHISSLIMEIHHTKHHQAYINNLIAATKKVYLDFALILFICFCYFIIRYFNYFFFQLKEAEAANDTASINSLLPAIQFNGGGHLNHTIFWSNMGPGGGGKPTGAIAKAIDSDFGSFDKFKVRVYL